MKYIEGKLVAPAKGRFAVVISRFNEFITSKLLGGCIDGLVRHGADEAGIEVVWSPAAEDDRMSTAELEQHYPELEKLDEKAIAGRVFCAHCSGPFPMELLACPHCGAPVSKATRSAPFVGRSGRPSADTHGWSAGRVAVRAAGG